jgi:hypothetical protein
VNGPGPIDRAPQGLALSLEFAAPGGAKDIGMTLSEAGRRSLESELMRRERRSMRFVGTPSASGGEIQVFLPSDIIRVRHA